MSQARTSRQHSMHSTESFGIKLKVEEEGIENLHMRREGSQGHVREFIRLAKELLAKSPANKGIITIGDGDAAE
ncbi:hypothetical protein U1Q18_013627 [Sarracenia purpurea var. burkii]